MKRGTKSQAREYKTVGYVMTTMNRTQLSAVLGTTIKFKKRQQSKSTGSWSVYIDRQKEEKGF